MNVSETCSINHFLSFPYRKQNTLDEITVLGGVIAVRAKAASTKLFKKKWLKEPWGAWEREGSLSESIYLWYGDDSFPPTSQQTKRFLPFECTQPYLSLKLKHMQWITTILKSCQETREDWLEERRWGGGMWGCAVRERLVRRTKKWKTAEMLLSLWC